MPNALLRRTIQTRIVNRKEPASAEPKHNVRKKWERFPEEKTQRGRS